MYREFVLGNKGQGAICLHERQGRPEKRKKGLTIYYILCSLSYLRETLRELHLSGENMLQHVGYNIKNAKLIARKVVYPKRLVAWAESRLKTLRPPSEPGDLLT
jgi:hypothetical protein